MNNRERLNTKLLTTLSGVLFIPSAELVAATGIASSSWYRLMENPEKITIQQLLAIANGLHIPVRRFFSDFIGRRDDYIIDDYQPCYYDAQELARMFRENNELTWKEAAEITGVTYQNLQKSLLSDGHTPVRRFLTVCHAFNINPFTILIDPNPKTRPGRNRSASNTPDMHRQIADLNAKVEELTSKFQKLLERQNNLENKLQDYIGEDRLLAADEGDEG